MDHAPRERVDAGDIRDTRLAQKPGRGDQELGAQRLATGQRELPGAGLVVPAGAFDGGVEPDVAPHVVLVGDVLGVTLQFGAGRIHPRPERVRFEPVGERRRRLIDSKAGIVIDVPGSAQVVLTVDDQDVVIAHPLELDRCADSAETRPHDDRVELLGPHELETLPHRQDKDEDPINA